MRWTPGGSSSDIVDERGSSGGGGFGGLPIGGGGLGCGGIVILLVLSLLFHKNFFALFEGGQSSAPRQQASAPPASQTPDEQQKYEFAKFVINDVQKTWDTVLPQESNEQYHHAKLDLFRDATRSACGTASDATGPFYCPLDERIYLDLGFFDELSQRFGAPGQFGQAYVIAHEAGHHVQHILGISDKVHDAEESSPDRANELSVRLELQADCFAGVWAHNAQTRNILDPGDIDQGLAAAASVGDDRLQRMAGRRVNPEKWTHGSAEQRSTWFRRGFESGHIANCDTFAAR
jgi:predicted metalloprotease